MPPQATFFKPLYSTKPLKFMERIMAENTKRQEMSTRMQQMAESIDSALSEAIGPGEFQETLINRVLAFADNGADKLDKRDWREFALALSKV